VDRRHKKSARRKENAERTWDARETFVLLLFYESRGGWEAAGTPEYFYHHHHHHHASSSSSSHSGREKAVVLQRASSRFRVISSFSHSKRYFYGTVGHSFLVVCLDRSALLVLLSRGGAAATSTPSSTASRRG